jgi:hypothetical protein
MASSSMPSASDDTLAILDTKSAEVEAKHKPDN